MPDNNDIYAVFLDIDGTLIYNSHIMSGRVKNTLERVKAAGHKVFLNSGRSLRYLPKELKAQFCWDGFVAGCGSSVYINGKTVFDRHMDKELLKKVCDFYFSEKTGCLLEGEDILLSINEPPHPDKVPLRSPKELETLYVNRRINKITMDGVLSDRGKKLLLDYFDCIQFDNYAELVLKGVSKAEGMKTAMRYIRADKSLAIGDSLNDMAMLEAADVSVAMGNAPDYIKNVCDFTTDSVFDDGAAVFLENYLLRNCKNESL